MSGLLQKILGGQPPAAPSPVPAAEDADFADFAGAPDPSPASITPALSAESITQAATATARALPVRPYTKWYRVWERTSWRDFYSEMFVMPFVLIVVFIHLFGSRKNKRKAKAWIAAHTPVLQEEFASVGFSGTKLPSIKEQGGAELRKSLESNDLAIPSDLMRQKSAHEWISYATGRQNVAFVDIKVTMVKRYNPMARMADEILGMVFASQPAPREKMEATSYVFDGREGDLVPSQGSDGIKEKFNSTFDGFVFAIVHKDSMRFLRDSRYDLSLTVSKDHAKLPEWLVVMSESAEITEAILTPDLVNAVHEAGEDLEALVVTDMPLDQPKKLNEIQPKKRITLSMHLPPSATFTSHNHQLSLFQQFLRLPDFLAANAHFRPEAMRRVRATREEETRKIRKLDEDERSEKRRLDSDKEKKEEREKRLKGLSADEQKKFLERERQADLRKSNKKRTVRA